MIVNKPVELENFPFIMGTFSQFAKVRGATFLTMELNGVTHALNVFWFCSFKFYCKLKEYTKKVDSYIKKFFL